MENTIVVINEKTMFSWEVPQQFPVDVYRKKTACVALPPLKFENHFDNSGYAILTNKGPSVALALLKTNGQTPRLRGGPLGDGSAYVFSGMHMLWARNDTSEMELYIVHHLESCSSVGEASNVRRGLAVTVFPIEEGEVDEPYFEELISALPLVTTPDISAAVPREILKLVKGKARPNGYYTFVGPGMSPPLTSATVVWMLFTDPVLISRRQMRLFREISAERPDHKIHPNLVRSIQRISSSLICYAT